jgi:hypothetical protein
VYYAGVWDVEYTNEFGAWWSTLSADQQERIDAAIELLERHGPTLGRPWVDTLSTSALANLKELRVRRDAHLRILFAFDPRRTAILLLGGDKTGRWEAWYAQAIPTAERLYEAHLNELAEEGEIEHG